MHTVLVLFLTTERHNDNKDTDLNMVIIQDHDNIPRNYLISDIIPVSWYHHSTYFCKGLKEEIHTVLSQEVWTSPCLLYLSMTGRSQSTQRHFPCQCNSAMNVCFTIICHWHIRHVHNCAVCHYGCAIGAKVILYYSREESQAEVKPS